MRSCGFWSRYRSKIQSSFARKIQALKSALAGRLRRRRGELRASPLIRFLAYVRPHRVMIAGAALMGIGKFVLPLAFPLAFKYVVDVLLVPQPKLEPINALIDRWCVWGAGLLKLQVNPSGKLVALSLAMFILYLVQAVATYYRSYWASVAGHRLIFDLRYRLFRHMQHLSHSFFDQNPSGAIISRFISDIHLAQNFVGSALTNIWMDGASLGFVIWILFVLDRRMAWISLGVVPFYLVFIRFFSPRIKEASHELQEVLEEFSGELQERIAGVSTIKSFAREDYEARRFHDYTTRLYDLTIDNVRLSSMHQMFTELITRTAPVVVVWAASMLILRGGMQLGTMVAFASYLGYLYLPLQRFSELSMVVSNSLAAIERVFAFFDVRPDVAEHPLAVPLKVKRGSVEFDRVSFSYKPRDGSAPRTVLHDIHFKIGEGTRVALVGRSGAGKTTLASLVPRFYDVSAGRVLINGKDIRHVTLASLRESVGIVPQDTVLFSSTVRDNLLYGKPSAQESTLWQALERANLRGFVESLPQGLDTIIGERGVVKLSGGQRQRLALARVFVKDPPILILDEATSALDSEVENLIHDAMRRLMQGRTSFLIAHRLSTAVEADLIVTLDHGNLVEIGTHAQLLGDGGIYAQLFYEQARSLIPDFDPIPRPPARAIAPAESRQRRS